MLATLLGWHSDLNSNPIPKSNTTRYFIQKSLGNKVDYRIDSKIIKIINFGNLSTLAIEINFDYKTVARNI